MPEVTVEQLDTTRRRSVYDGAEPADWSARHAIPLARPDYAFSLAELDRRPFRRLVELLGPRGFARLVEGQGYRAPRSELEGYRGSDGLPLYFYLRPDARPGAVKLLLVSFGEYQPGRYLAHFEGIYRVTGVESWDLPREAPAPRGPLLRASELGAGSCAEFLPGAFAGARRSPASVFLPSTELGAIEPTIRAVAPSYDPFGVTVLSAEVTARLAAALGALRGEQGARVGHPLGRWLEELARGGLGVSILAP